MNQVQQLIARFKTRARCSAVSKLDALTDLERLSDPQIVPFLLQIVADRDELPEVRSHVIKRLRNRALAPGDRAPVANTMSQILTETVDPDPRLQSVVALGEFTDVVGVLTKLEAIALDAAEPLDLRYSAFTSLERAGPTAESTEILRRLALDETLGGSARRLLSIWRVQ